MAILTVALLTTHYGLAYYLLRPYLLLTMALRTTYYGLAYYSLWPRLPCVREHELVREQCGAMRHHRQGSAHTLVPPLRRHLVSK